jgi:hypothetical protein
MMSRTIRWYSGALHLCRVYSVYFYQYQALMGALPDYPDFIFADPYLSVQDLHLSIRG